ncbi:unnamed protein product [Adineta ricciae]|nr:unnamed protein product [Adineta ricciae]
MYNLMNNTWTEIADMLVPRAYHSATMLPSGKILVVGGYDGDQPQSTCEIYDPSSNITGDLDSLDSSATLSCEIYDSISNKWCNCTDISVARASHTTTLLPSQKVLITGGVNDPFAVLYNSSSNKWNSAGEYPDVYFQYTATLLSSGSVLLLGGSNSRDVTSTSMLYDTHSDTWNINLTTIPPLTLHTTTLLFNEQILISGGQENGRIVALCRIYDLICNNITNVTKMASVRYQHSAILLP